MNTQANGTGAARPRRRRGWGGRWLWLGPVLVLVALCSCGKSGPKAAAYQPAADPDPERGKENQIQQLLARLNTRETEVGTLARVAGNTMTAEQAAQARAARDEFYAQDPYVEALRAAQTAIKNKMMALKVERAILANLKDTNLLASAGTPAPVPARTNAVPADERAEELKLKTQLVELGALNEDLLITSPASGQVSPETRDKAETARDDIYTPEEYVARLGLTVDLMQKRLQGLDAEAALYDKLLGLNSDAPQSGRH